MGMAHRGRLNILTSVMRKNFDVLFEQFSENYIPETVGGDGDVKKRDARPSEPVLEYFFFLA